MLDSIFIRFEISSRFLTAFPPAVPTGNSSGAYFREPAEEVAFGSPPEFAFVNLPEVITENHPGDPCVNPSIVPSRNSTGVLSRNPSQFIL